MSYIVKNKQMILVSIIMSWFRFSWVLVVDKHWPFFRCTFLIYLYHPWAYNVHDTVNLVSNRESHLAVTLRRDKSQEGEVDPMSASIISNKYVSALYDVLYRKMLVSYSSWSPYTNSWRFTKKIPLTIK